MSWFRNQRIPWPEAKRLEAMDENVAENALYPEKREAKGVTQECPHSLASQPGSGDRSER